MQVLNTRICCLSVYYLRTLLNLNTWACLTLLLLNTTCPVLANIVDPEQLASEEAN